MIPHKIHYFWFGKNKSDLVKRCIDSWHCLQPEFEIQEWNESNYDVQHLSYTKRVYNSGVYGLAVCQARFDVLYQHGGIYLDTDVEVITQDVNAWKSLLNNQSLIFGYETNPRFNKHRRVGAGFIASEPKHPFMQTVVNTYENLNRRFATAPKLLTDMLVLSKPPSDSLILPHNIFSPMTWEEFSNIEQCNHNKIDPSKYITSETLAFHWYQSSWHGKTKQIR